MKNKLLTLMMMVVVAGCSAVWAWDTTPNPETGLYDGLYDRPTYFPAWEQPSTWPNVMYVLCDVRKENATGERVASYEVAVYDQDNNLRHCNRSLAKQDHYCVLTIKGEEGDIFHFRVFYGADFAHPLVSDVQGVTVPFETNGKVGSADPLEPFVLTIQEGTPTGFDEVESQKSKVESRKMLRDGQLFIIRDGKTYSVTGAEVESRK